jgi:hypothetical protein
MTKRKINWWILTDKEFFAISKFPLKQRQYSLVWTCRVNGGKQNSQRSVVFEFGKKTQRRTKKWMDI